MEHEGSLPHSQVPATCLYPEPDQSCPCPHPTCWRFIFILFSHLRFGLPNGLFPSCFPAKTLIAPLLAPIRATCSANLILLDLITRIMFCEQCRSLTYTLPSLNDIHVLTMINSSHNKPNKSTNVKTIFYAQFVITPTRFGLSLSSSDSYWTYRL